MAGARGQHVGRGGAAASLEDIAGSGYESQQDWRAVGHVGSDSGAASAAVDSGSTVRKTLGQQQQRGSQSECSPLPATISDPEYSSPVQAEATADEEATASCQDEPGAVVVEQTDESLYEWQLRVSRRHFSADPQQQFVYEPNAADVSARADPESWVRQVANFGEYKDLATR